MQVRALFIDLTVSGKDCDVLGVRSEFSAWKPPKILLGMTSK